MRVAWISTAATTSCHESGGLEWQASAASQPRGPWAAQVPRAGIGVAAQPPRVFPSGGPRETPCPRLFPLPEASWVLDHGPFVRRHSQQGASLTAAGEGSLLSRTPCDKVGPTQIMGEPPVSRPLTFLPSAEPSAPRSHFQVLEMGVWTPSGRSACDRGDKTHKNGAKYF